MKFSEFKKIAHRGKEDKIASSSWLYKVERLLSLGISWSLINVFPKILPNHISLANIVIVLFVFVLNLITTSENALTVVTIQFLLIFLTAIGDKVDGEIARAKKYFTQAGLYYDRVYHFIYPLALYGATGYFFYIKTDWLPIFIFTILALALITLTEALSKLRHHIKHKIQLEEHERVIKDLYKNPITVAPQSLIARLIHYIIFLIYDWVLLIYIGLIVVSIFNPGIAIVGFILHLVLTIIFSLKYIFSDFPKASLFAKADFEAGN